MTDKSANVVPVRTGEPPEASQRLPLRAAATPRQGSNSNTRRLEGIMNGNGLLGPLSEGNTVSHSIA